MKKIASDIDNTKRLMGALVRMKPKPHKEIKIKRTKIIPAKTKAKQKKKP